MQYPKMIVVCEDHNGFPSIYPCKVACTLEQIADYDHYEKAMDQAMDDGYIPLIAISEQDGAFTDFNFKDGDFH